MKRNEMNYDTPEELDLSNAHRSPYPKLLKQQVTINLSKEVIDYFKEQGNIVGVSFEELIGLYLTHCANKHIKLNLNWK